MIVKKQFKHLSERLSESRLQVPHINNVKWLSFPYLLWMAGFIIIPLIMIVFYGLSGKEGGFTLHNISMISDPVNRKALFINHLDYCTIIRFHSHNHRNLRFYSD